MWKYLLLTAVLVVAALVAGALLGPRVLTSSLDSAEERWFFSPRSDYTMTIDHQCFCPWEKYTVTVRSTQPTRMVTTEGRRLSLRDARAFGSPLTVDDLFMLVHALIAEFGSENVNVTYDPQWGYPVTIGTGGRADTVDDEISVTVTSFHEGR